MTTDDEGTYTLVIELDRAATVTFGAAGDRDLAAGGYAYTGSAFGAGGFSRIERHRDLAQGERDTRHWHIDYLLGHPATDVAGVVRTAGQDVECAVAQAIDADPVPGIGASDCDCATHLAYAPAVERLEQAVSRAHEAARE